MTERDELVDQAIWLIKEAKLSREQWRKMITDVFSPEYLVDVMEDSVINWDSETLKNFVNVWREELGLKEIPPQSFPEQATSSDFHDLLRNRLITEFETFESFKDARAFESALEKSLSGREAQLYTQVDASGGGVVYLKGHHLVNRTGVYLVAWK